MAINVIRYLCCDQCGRAYDTAVKAHTNIRTQRVGATAEGWRVGQGRGPDYCEECLAAGACAKGAGAGEGPAP